jgi:hypothetical protein
MIFVFFVPGMFGSTVEALTSAFTLELLHNEEETSLLLADDGSMHLATKQMHQITLNGILSSVNSQAEICTPIYPARDAELPEIAAKLELSSNDKVILIYADSYQAAEINLLFQYHKIVAGSGQKSISVMTSEGNNWWANWNENYTSWRDVQTWEMRDYICGVYPDNIRTWMDSKNVKFNQPVLLIPSSDLLNNIEATFIKICEYLNLTVICKPELNKFCNEWTKAQQYIVEEYKLIELIAEKILNKIDFNWRSLNIIAEAIIQQKLRFAGYDIRSYGLNEYPTNSLVISNLLEKM